MHQTLNEKLIQSELEHIDDKLHHKQDSGNQDSTSTVKRTEHGRKKTFRYWSWLSGVIASYDLCMAFPLDDETKFLTKFCVHYLEHLSHIGIDFFLCYSLQKDFIYILFRAKIQRLRLYAAEVEYPMLLDPQKLQEVAEQGDSGKGISPLLIAHVPEESRIRPHEFVYAPYRLDVDENLYWRPRGADGSAGEHPFRDLERLKLTERMIETASGVVVDEDALLSEDKGIVNIRKHLNNGNILAYFPLHRQAKLDAFVQKWLPWHVLPWQAPFFEIKEYLGEKIALYFQFMGLYSRWLRYPAAMGLPIQLYMLIANDYNSPAQVMYSVFLVMWAVVMLEFWKRKEKSMSMQWGMEDFEETEQDRPEFKGKLMKSFIHGKDIVYFPATERYKKICLSSTIVFLFIVLVVGVVISIYVMRAALSNSLGSVAQLIASVVNAVQIQIFNYYYESLVDDLTEWENHRTDTEFEDSMITKLYLFQFVNSYASFFYVAFIASSIPSETSAHGDCGASTCMIPLGLNLAIIFGVQEAVTITTDGIIPYLLHRYRSFRLKEYAQEEFGQQDLPQISKEFLLDGYDILKGALGEYAEMAVQFGYILLFATALPIAPLMGLATCLLESKADTFKFLFLKRRPRMKGAEDIGMWQTIFTLTASAAIVTNAAIAVFTMDIFNDRQTDVRFWFFIIYQWIVFSFQAVLMALIPDEPYAIEIQRERRKILVDKVIFKIPDVDAAEVDYVKFDADAIRKFTVHEFAEQHEFKAEGQPVSENQRPRSLVRPTLDRVGAARDVRVDSGEKDMFQSMSGADPGGHMGKGDLVARDVKRASGQWQPPSSPTIDSPSPNTPRRGMHLYTDMSTKKLAKATADTVTPKSRVLPRQRSSITSPSSKDKSSVKNRTRKPSFFTFGQKSSKTIAKDDNL